ncbi:DUF2993 domain-containing protein [Streptomyces sp. NPDC093085]|uniref:LmeA family phospholipid-binding protein n=1 Tax=Streptomyces sp. NPDC093085 TaxID=3155068 RepID=UPI00341C4637
MVLVLGALAVGADRLAVHLAEGQAAEKLQSSAGLATTPEVSIKGFPFLTQIATGEVEEIDASIGSYEATVPGGGTGRIDQLELQLKSVEFTNSFTSATARSATGTALIPYSELLKAAPDGGQGDGAARARITGLSDGGNGRIKAEVSAVRPDTGKEETYTVLSTVEVSGDTIRVRADELPSEAAAVPEDQLRQVTDFQQTLTRLPGGISVQRAEPLPDGLRITVGGANVSLTG